jgi:hypothetical protein
MPIFAQNSPLYSYAYMPAGPFERHRLDTSKLRGLVLMTVSQLPNEVAVNHAFVGNFTHNGKFYVAKIPIHGFTSVSLIYEKFTDMAGGHADVVYHLSESSPVQLIYEIKDANNIRGYDLIRLENPILLPDIVLTAEAVTTVNDKVGLVEGGLTNELGMAYRLTSVTERLAQPVLEEGRDTKVYNAPLSPAETEKSFWRTIIDESKEGMSTNYNLLMHNCITSALEALSNGLNKTEKFILESKLSKTMLQLSRLHTEELKEHKAQAIIIGLLHDFKIHNQEIKSTPIQESKFFVDSLTKEQKQLMTSKSCSLLFH